ncbi:MAG: hypothetical protein F4Z96_08310, partial [Chloroflexi bacterium]|nr:hypothetical protein [Chloroflexota bacterium]
MPLHPQAQAFLEVAEAANALMPPLEERDAAEWRTQGQELAERASHLPFSPPVHSETDRTIPGPAGEIPVRVLTPGPGGDYPVLVWFHGGGWVLPRLEAGIHALRLH